MPIGKFILDNKMVGLAGQYTRNCTRTDKAQAIKPWSSIPSKKAVARIEGIVLHEKWDYLKFSELQMLLHRGIYLYGCFSMYV